MTTAKVKCQGQNDSFPRRMALDLAQVPMPFCWAPKHSESPLFHVSGSPKIGWCPLPTLPIPQTTPNPAAPPPPANGAPMLGSRVSQGQRGSSGWCSAWLPLAPSSATWPRAPSGRNPRPTFTGHREMDPWCVGNEKWNDPKKNHPMWIL